ncbi:MAG: winged helix-turn-helix domain-containing protein [Rhodanobacter sp.]
MRENGDAGVYRCGAHTISPATRRLYRDGAEADIEAKVFDLILLLLENRDRALGKQEVVTALWGHRPITDAALSQLLHKARRALDDNGERQAVIRTVYGRGLQWVAPVSLDVDDSPSPSPDGDASDLSAMVVVPAAATPGRRPHAWWVAALGAVLLLGALASWILLRNPSSTPAPAPRMALLPIVNETGDAALDWTARGLPGLVASLLGDQADLDVVDPLQVAKAWSFTPPRGKTRTEHTRYVTTADIVVGGKLTLLPGKVYQLTLHVDAGKGGASDVVISASTPGALGVDAVGRLRHALKLDPPATSPFKATPQDAYLAETFARGTDLAMHGDWQGARPYFVLVAKGQPDLLPARFLLARAQSNTDQMKQADAGYAALLVDARRLGRRDMVARVLADQIADATNRHENANALNLVGQALAAAREAGDPDITARVLMSAARSNARIQQIDTALKQYEQARLLIEQTPLRTLEPRLHNTMAFIANAKNDAAGAIAAARAELDADEALGNERSSNIAGFNLAYALSTDQRPLEALPLLIRTWNWSDQHHDDALQVATANLMTALLYDLGVYEEVRPVIDTAVQLAAAQDNGYMQSQLLGLRAGGEYFGGDKAAALTDCRKASALIDPAQDPATAVDKLAIEAFVALAAEPASVAGLRRRVDSLVGRIADPAGSRFMQYLVHALAAAASGDRLGARTALDAAAHAPQASRDLLRQFALQIALVTRDDTIAQDHLRDFRLDDADLTADTLRLYGAWSARRGDQENQRRATARLHTLRQAPLDVLARAHFEPVHTARESNGARQAPDDPLPRH